MIYTMNKDLPYIFNYTIGALWGSGHGKKDVYTFQCNYPIEHIVNLTLRIKDVFNFDFSDIAAEYGEYHLSESVIEIFKKAQIPSYFDPDEGEDYATYLDQDALLYYWEKLLLIIDPKVTLERITLDDVSRKMDKSIGYGLYD